MAASSRGSTRYLVLGLLLVWINNCTFSSGMGPCNTTTVPLKMDEARVTIVSRTDEDIYILTRTTECHTCVLEMTAVLDKNSNCTIPVDTRWPLRYEIIDSKDKREDSCREQTWSFAEYGDYTIYIKYNNSHDKIKILCNPPVLMNMPVDSNKPIYIAIGILVGAALIWIFIVNCHKRHWFNRVLLRSGAERLIVDPSQNEPHKLADNLKEGKHPTLRKRKRLKNPKQSSTNSSNVYTSQDLGSMTNMQTNINPVDNEENKPKKERLKSLDTFRGLSILIMIFVNYRGGGYWFFNHSRWNGLTVADLVFPWLKKVEEIFYTYFKSHDGSSFCIGHETLQFVFIMGTAIAFSYKTQLRRGVRKHKIFLKIVKRSCILFLLGLIINTSSRKNPVELSKLRIPGVLQRFAGTYLIIATLHLLFVRSPDSSKLPDSSTISRLIYNKVRDILDYWPEWLLNFGLLGIHLGLTFGLDVPGCPKGYLGPGGDANNGSERNCTGGAAGYIDRKIFGDQHIYANPTCKHIYNTTKTYDPEGLLGTLTSCFMCFLGLQAGKILMYFKEPRSRVIRFLIWGAILCLIAGVLCKFSKDDGWIPINKNLWSVSFVICLAGMGFFVLTFCYLTIDVWSIWNGAPFYYPGMNSIVMYTFHECLNNVFPVSFYLDKTHTLQLVVNIWGPVFWCAFTYMMFRKKMFISV